MATCSMSSHSRFGVHVCRFFVVATVLGSLCFLIWICLTPKYPVFSITNVQIPALPQRNFTFNHLFRNTPVILNFEIRNPNEGFRVHYDDTFITLHRNNSVVGNRLMPGFQQNYHNTTVNQVLLYLSRQFWRGIRRSRTVDIRVHVTTGLKFQYRIFKTKTKHQRIELEALLTFVTDGKILTNKIELRKKRQLQR